ncbi:primosomal protein N' [Vibrio sp. UCD-FRSSP16_10]|uniref:primosomal protein N' n=1 Tax=unclassified Vibrio TaxID=2614977 RepID=UPI0007FF1962|nr:MULTISPECIES: primosomal protein N' [unclassified Vibrio]OBT10215.1 primosomal protein N' [Vibrio sp. UCD-FRSSP16_30]OBT19005.1 primosomal protein N' [Vibrio sp. UCD-FRSSP16_10]
MRPTIARVALPVPLDKEFEYLIPAHLFPVLGTRVWVPFGPSKRLGVITALTHQSEYDINKLKPLIEVLDFEPIWPEKLYKLIHWGSRFYQYPLGETLNGAMPGALRKGKPAQKQAQKTWQLTESGKNQLMQGFGRAVQQAKVMNALQYGALPHHELIDLEVSSSVLKTLQQKQWIDSTEVIEINDQWQDVRVNETDKRELNHEQMLAVVTVNHVEGYECALLDGVTGSGKTEVYLQLIESVINQGKQALVLVPEIGLTPQTINRFKRRFNVPIATIHSGLNDSERLNAWLAAKNKECGILIGTRSALLTPFAELGIIIVDEEHDSSYKQQDSLRYHARDMAIMRAHSEGVPIVLGSATPSLETLNNALSGKYLHLQLTERAGGAKPAKNSVIDVKGLYLESGLSAPIIAQMRKHLQQGNQVMLFLNRRGFSPALMCHECGWIAECHRCDAYYTFHQGSREMRCHHCGSQKAVVHQCEGCGSTNLVTVGVGTEQLEAHLEALFPEFKTIRIDRDNTRRKGSLEAALESIRNGEYQILIGTQMLAKGHHFPDVTLVGLLDVDSSLYSSDFRASEKLAQLFIQVAGRAGRASKPGHVVLQTHHPEHSLLQALLHKGYPEFAQSALMERRVAQLPPYASLSLFRAESNHSQLAEDFLRQVRQTLEAHPLFDQQCWVLGPTPAPMAKRAGKSRWQLILQCQLRSTMHKLLMSAKPALEILPNAKKVRWNIDVEPVDLS